MDIKLFSVRPNLYWGWAVVLVLASACSGCRDRVSSVAAHTQPPTTSSVSSGGAQQSYADIVDRVSPAVVTIRSARRLHPPQQFRFFDSPLFRQFFRNSYRQPPRAEGPVMEALGSGVIVSDDGRIVTNHHVVDGADQITVELSDRRTFDARLVGTDPPSDIAVLKVGANRLPVLSLGDSDKVRVGDVCLAVGNPLGIGETVTFGIISAKGRSTGLGDGSFQDFLQTDAAINRGNSGGALVNTSSELIGINSQILSPTGTNIGIGFAIPSNMTREVLNQLNHGSTVRRGMLGVSLQAITSKLAEALNLKEIRGVLVNSVMPGSPAAQAGLQQGDVITALNGTPVNDPNSLRNKIATTPPGSEVTLTVLREGKEQQIRVKLGSLSANAENTATPGSDQQSGTPPLLGLSVEPLPPQAAKQLGIRSGQGALVVAVDPAGPAAEAGIQEDDVILEVNRQPVKSAADIKAQLARSGSRPALLLINRDGQNIFLTVQPGSR